NKLNEDNKNKELTWLYTCYSEVEMRKGNLESAKEYLRKAEMLYEEYKFESYANSDLELEKLRIMIGYRIDREYEYTLNEYNNLLKVISERGIKSDILYLAIEDIIEIAYENEDYEAMVKYMKQVSSDYESYESGIETDTVFEKFKSEVYEKNTELQKLKFKGVVAGLILSLIMLIITHYQNKKIKKLNLELEEKSITDSLTGLYNKRFLYSKFEDVCKLEKEITFIMIDIDCFKNYNDNYGHIKGDEALVKVGNILKEAFNNDFVFRYGGEEFCIISELPKEDVIKKFDALRNCLFEANIEHKYSDVSYRLTISIGVEYSKITSMEDVDRVTRNADEKLYISKKDGRNKCTY
ncbi:MAG: GGDEF domain-containing protein, partial [Clostridium sp.]